MKKTKNNIMLILSIGLIFFSNSCENPMKKHELKTGIINNLGEYENKKDKTILYISDENHILKYKLSINDTVVVNSNENISMFQKWLLYWDKNGNLWIDSSDIGIWVWSKNTEGLYKKYFLKDRPASCNPIPNVIKVY